MTTKLLHEKIDRFTALVNKGQMNNDFAKELLRDVNTWLSGIDKYIETIELEKAELGIAWTDQQDEINRLHKIITIIGEGKALVASSIMDKELYDLAIDFLFDNKDRVNAGNIYSVGKLLELAEKEGIVIKTMVQLVKYARGVQE